jgi:uncharacterized membrane protein YcaP (DUF421 family)
MTLIGIDVLLSYLKLRFPRVEGIIDGLPVVIVDRGKPLSDIMRKSRVDEQDILEAARRLQGLERMEQIKYAVLEPSGGITIVPFRN